MREVHGGEGEPTAQLTVQERADLQNAGVINASVGEVEGDILGSRREGSGHASVV